MFIVVIIVKYFNGSWMFSDIAETFLESGPRGLEVRQRRTL